MKTQRRIAKKLIALTATKCDILKFPKASSISLRRDIIIAYGRPSEPTA